MKETLNKLVEVVQSENLDHGEAGKMLASAMAMDGMSYYDAHCKLHHMMEVLEKAEEHVAKAAFKELARDNRRMSADLMNDESNHSYKM